MVYDKELDKTIWEKEVEIGVGNFIVIGVYKYGEAVPKIGIIRKQDSKFKSLGRIRYGELKLVMPALKEVMEYMEEEK